MSFWSRMRGNGGSLLVAVAATLGVAASGLLLQPKEADAARDERTLSLYEIHLKETTTVTFKRDGKYIPSGLKKLNHAMRDWRTGAVTRMDPKLFDLVWQLAQDVGSTRPVHVISGHRSAKTNRKLRKRGGGQAKKSQHVRGRAMDIHFPGISISKVRKAAFVHEVGGVGYYPTSALPFVHVDTARVRAWPRMSRTQLAMLFPHGATKHRPSSGGRLTSRDRKKARIRIAALERKKRSRSNILLASAAIPAAKISPAIGDRPTSKPTAPANVDQRRVVLASLAQNPPGTLEVPGLPRHAARLWINGAQNRAPVKRPTNRLIQTASKGQNPFNEATAGKGASYAKSPSRIIPSVRPKAPQARIQLASLSPQENIRRQPDPRKNLWVNGAGLRATWLTETEPVAALTKRQNPPKRLIEQAEPAVKPAAKTHTIAQFTPTKPQGRQKPVQHKFDTERVAYAPTFDEEHPDELSYRPFQILPLMSSKPVALNKSLVAMVEPKYDRVYEILMSSENIPMQFRPSSSEAETLWNNQFKGNAIINIRKQALNRLLPTRPQRLASR